MDLPYQPSEHGHRRPPPAMTLKMAAQVLRMHPVKNGGNPPSSTPFTYLAAVLWIAAVPLRAAIAVSVGVCLGRHDTFGDAGHHSPNTLKVEPSKALISARSRNNI